MANTKQVEELCGGVAPHEAFRIRMVGVAMRRIERLPNWRRGFGFSVGADWWPEIVGSMQAVRAELEERFEREAEELERQGRPLARVPEVFEVMTMAVFLLLVGRKAAWPLPVGVPMTLEAMGRFFAEETRRRLASPSECDGVERAEGWGSGEIAGVRRTVH